VVEVGIVGLVPAGGAVDGDLVAGPRGGGGVRGSVGGAKDGGAGEAGVEAGGGGRGRDGAERAARELARVPSDLGAAERAHAQAAAEEAQRAQGQAVRGEVRAGRWYGRGGQRGGDRPGCAVVGTTTAGDGVAGSGWGCGRWSVAAGGAGGGGGGALVLWSDGGGGAVTAMVLLYLDQPEICQVARLNSAFRGAASADCVWAAKLPDNYRYLVDLAAAADDEGCGDGDASVKRLTKKEIYVRAGEGEILQGTDQVAVQRRLWNR
jgi:hypothetical protein